MSFKLKRTIELEIKGQVYPFIETEISELRDLLNVNFPEEKNPILKEPSREIGLSTKFIKDSDGVYRSRMCNVYPDEMKAIIGALSVSREYQTLEGLQTKTPTVPKYKTQHILNILMSETKVCRVRNGTVFSYNLRAVTFTPPSRDEKLQVISFPVPDLSALKNAQVKDLEASRDR